MNARLGSSIRGEDGAVAVTVAILLTVLLAVSAFVLDLGALRADRIAGKSVADMAASGAVVDYRAGAPGGALAACEHARDLTAANIPAIDSLISSDAVGGATCQAIFDSYTCDPDATITEADERQAVYQEGDYNITITLPVADGSAVLMDDRSHGDFDGHPCDRIGVQVNRDRSFLLGAFGGLPGATSTPGSVARSFVGTRGIYASLIVLEEEACAALAAQGNASIRVAGTDENPGVITVDSRPDGGSCTDTIYHRQGNPNEIYASHDNYSFALLSGDDPSDVYEASRPPDPVPIPGDAITRSPVDYEFNCLSSYPSNRRWSPSHTAAQTIPIDPCTGDGQPHLRDLWNEFDGLRHDNVSSEWSVIGENADDGMPGCSTNPPSTSRTFGPAPNETGDGLGRLWFIDCPGSEFEPADFHFRDVDAIVVRGGVDYGGNNRRLRVTDGTNGTILYLQTGNFDPHNAHLQLEDTFVYIEDGTLTATGSPVRVWRAPRRSLGCGTVAGAPSAGCLAPLALWSNSSTTHELSGGANVTVKGSFFTPNARFILGGNPDQPMDGAQFFAGRLAADGTPTVHLTPDPDSMIEVPIEGSGLIR